MNAILKHMFKSAINSRKEGSFNDFVNELFIKSYGTSFNPVKQKRDKGCDGILKDMVIIAAYAPQNANLREFKKKTSKDFVSYKNNWQSNYPEWRYVYNGEYTAEMILHLKSLKNDVVRMDINSLLDTVEQLPYSKRRELALSLGIDEQYIVNDIFKAVIEDLFKSAEDSDDTGHVHEAPPYIEDKIKLNFVASDVEDALKGYECVLEYFSQLKNILKSYQSYEISSLKTKLISCYNKLAGDFKTRLNNLADEFAERNKNDDSYVFFVRVALIYFFEICVIGQKPESER